MSYHLSPNNIAWRVSNIVQVPTGLTFVVISFWYLESPRWLLDKYPETPERSLATLAKLRSGTIYDEHVRLELHELITSFEYRKRFKTGYMGLFASAGMRKRFACGFYAMGLNLVLKGVFMGN